MSNFGMGNNLFHSKTIEQGNKSVLQKFCVCSQSDKAEGPWHFSASLNFAVNLKQLFKKSLTLQPRESQHTRPPCPSPTPGVHSDSRPSSQWCHPAISSCVIPFSSCLRSFPASGSSQISQHFSLGGQTTAVSVPESGRSPGEGNDNPLHYSCLGNPMDRGSCWATVHAFAESDMT